MEIKITKGSVIVADIITKKTSRAYSRNLWEGVEVSSKTDFKNLKYKAANLDNANAALVSNMAKSICIDSKQVEVTEDNLEDLDENDYDKILEECLKIKENSGKTEDKKK